MTTHPCELRCGQKDTSGTIVSIRDRILVVAVHEDLCPHIAHARVTADDSFLIVRLCERLQEVQAGTAQFNMDSAKRVIGAAPPRLSASWRLPWLRAPGRRRRLAFGRRATRKR